MSVRRSYFLIVLLFVAIFNIAIDDPLGLVVDIIVAYIVGLAVIT